MRADCSYWRLLQHACYSAPLGALLVCARLSALLGLGEPDTPRTARGGKKEKGEGGGDEDSSGHGAAGLFVLLLVSGLPCTVRREGGVLQRVTRDDPPTTRDAPPIAARLSLPCNWRVIPCNI